MAVVAAKTCFSFECVLSPACYGPRLNFQTTLSVSTVDMHVQTCVPLV